MQPGRNSADQVHLVTLFDQGTPGIVVTAGVVTYFDAKGVLQIFDMSDVDQKCSL